jgi:CzcA family heavy metal efflux pump
MKPPGPQASPAILLLAAALLAAGAIVTFRLPSSIFPPVTFPIVKVIADVGEQPAARMIPAVTRPLEEGLRRVPGIRRVVSTTSRGSAEMSGIFAWGTDMTVALQSVQAEIARIRPDLPSEARVEAQSMDTSIFPVLGYSLTSPTRPLTELRELAEYTLKPELLRISGVSRIQLQGGALPEFRVRLDPGQLAGRSLSAQDVIGAVKAHQDVLSAGLQEANHELYLTVVDGAARSRAELERIPIPVPGGGPPAHLSELGTVDLGPALNYIRTSANGQPSVLVNVIQHPDGNTVTIAREIAKLIATRPDLLPRDVSWTNFYDQAEFISHSVNGVRDAIIVGVILAGAILLFFLRDLRLTIVAVAVVPATFLLVLLALAALGQTLNLMTLGGIAAAIGLVADDAIVVLENIERHAGPPEEGLVDVLPPLLGSSLSTIVIFAPFALLKGVAGAFFRPLALTMALSLTASFLLCAFVLPAVLGRRKTSSAARPPREPDMPRLRRLVVFWVRHPALGLVSFILSLGAAVVLYRTIGTDFLPSMDEGSIILDYWTPPGTSLPDTDAMLGELEKIVLALPDVASYSRRTGTQLGFFITEPNRGDYVVKLKPRGIRRPVDEVIDDLRQKIAAREPVIHVDFGQLLEDDIGDLTGGEPQPVDVRLSGEDAGMLRAAARRAAELLRSVKGIEDVTDGIVVAGPALQLHLHSEEVGRYGLTPEGIAAALEPAVEGSPAGDIRIGERLFPIRLFLPHLANLGELPIRVAGGSLLPLSRFADVETGEPEAEINRENLKTYVSVTARLSGRSLGDAVSEIRSVLARQLPLPSGITVRFAGQFEQQQTSFKALLVVLLAGLVLVGIVLLFQFGDWRAPLLTAVAALAVLAGVFGALKLCGVTFNLSSFVGAIMMVGIVGEKSVFLLHDTREQLRRGVPPDEAWARAAEHRFRAVAMTTLAAVFALLPLALAWGEGSQMQQPLAIAVIGGFFLSGLLALLVLPSLYAWLDPHGRLRGDVPAAVTTRDS